MYSRYRIKEPTAPTAPPDYGGTALLADEPTVEIEPTMPIENDTIDENIEKIEELPPEEPEKAATIEENVQNIQNIQNIQKNIFDELTLDDLLFMGALALLMSGKMADESMLLLSYLLTCGL